MELLFQQTSGGFGPSSYTVAISPSVMVRGRIASLPFRTAFDPPVIFSISPSAILPTSATTAATAASPVIGSNTPSRGQSLFDTSSSGSVAIPAGRSAAFFGGMSVLDARIASLITLALLLLVAWRLGWPLINAAISEDETVRIAARQSWSLVETRALPTDQVVVVELSSFDGLTRVARRLECPVLHHRRGKTDVYAVVDNATLYRYSAPASTTSAPTPSESHNGNKPAEDSELAGAALPPGPKSTSDAAVLSPTGCPTIPCNLQAQVDELT